MRRRDWLLAAGGSMAGLPWLESLQPRLARAQSVEHVTPDGHPKRLLVCFKGNGVYADTWFPKAGSGPTDFELNEATAPLEPFKKDLIFFDGIDNRVIIDQKNTPGESHNRGCGSILTGWELNEGDIQGADGTSRGGYGKGPSVDQVVARQIGTDTPILSLQSGCATNRGNRLSRPINYEGNLKPLQAQADPQVLFDQVFKDTALPANDAEALKARRGELMDFVGRRFSKLNQGVGQADRERLEEHATLLSELQGRLQSAAAIACEAPKRTTGIDSASQDDTEAIVQACRDITVRALACGLTRVGTLMIGNGGNDLAFPFLDNFGADHGLGHGEQTDGTKVNQRLGRHVWHMEQLHDNLAALAAVKEGNGTLLDSTLVLFVTENSNGWHSHARHPMILAGGLGGQFETGRLLHYTGESHTKVLVSVLNAFGVEGKDFGNPAFNQGPLTGLI